VGKEPYRRYSTKAAGRGAEGNADGDNGGILIISAWAIKMPIPEGDARQSCSEEKAWQRQ